MTNSLKRLVGARTMGEPVVFQVKSPIKAKPIAHYGDKDPWYPFLLAQWEDDNAILAFLCSEYPDCNAACAELVAAEAAYEEIRNTKKSQPERWYAMRT